MKPESRMVLSIRVRSAAPPSQQAKTARLDAAIARNLEELGYGE